MPMTYWARCGSRHPDIAGTFLPLLVNELARLRKPVVLVLDGYHLISDPRLS